MIRARHRVRLPGDRRPVVATVALAVAVACFGLLAFLLSPRQTGSEGDLINTVVPEKAPASHGDKARGVVATRYA
jgi:hypothetical protein